MNRNPTSTFRTIDLDHDQMLILDDRAGARLRVLSGGVWLTEQGRPDDWFAHPGDELALSAPGRTVVEGLGPARVELELPVGPGPLRRMAQGLSAWVGGVAPPAYRGGALVLSFVLALGLNDLVARAFQ